MKITGRSVCDYCGKTLRVINLIPIISFLIQKGKSTCCGKKISWQYPLVELLSALMFVFIGWKSRTVSYFVWLLTEQGVAHDFHSWSVLGNWGPVLAALTLLFFIFIGSILLALVFTDLKYFLLPDRLVIGGVIGALFYWICKTGIRFFVFYNQLANDSAFIGQYLLKDTNFFWRQVWLQAQDFVFTIEGSLIIALAFLVLILVTKGKGMGGGDLKLSLLMGLVCGWPHMMVALFLGFFSGSIVSLVLMLFKIVRFGDRIPLGPFLAIATFVTMFYGDQILNFYYKLFLM